MTAKHPDNGPSFSRTPDKRRPAVNTTMAPSPARREAQLAQDQRDAVIIKEGRRLLRNGDVLGFFAHLRGRSTGT